jgi:hypothetical protein
MGGKRMGLKIDKPSLIPARAFCFSEGNSEKTKIYKNYTIEIILFCQEFLFRHKKAAGALSPGPDFVFYHENPGGSN